MFFGLLASYLFRLESTKNEYYGNDQGVNYIIGISNLRLLLEL